MWSTLQKILLGVEINQENFTLEQIPAVLIIIGLTIYIVFFTNFIDTITNIIESSSSDGINYWALSSFKFSFISTPAQLVLISLFRKINEPLKKYFRSFVMLLGGFVGVYVMVTLMDTSLFETVEGFNKILLTAFPILTIVIVRVSVRQDFDDRIS